MISVKVVKVSGQFLTECIVICPYFDRKFTDDRPLFCGLKVGPGN